LQQKPSHQAGFLHFSENVRPHTEKQIDAEATWQLIAITKCLQYIPFKLDNGIDKTVWRSDK